MSIQYAGGTIVNHVFTSDGTRLQIVNKLNTQLKLAGWSALSGDGSADVLLQSAVTPQSLSISLRALDPGANNCAQLILRNAAGTKVTNTHYQLPVAGRDYRLIANKYQFWLFPTGSINISLSRQEVMGGTIYLPSNIAATITDDEAGWIVFNGASDAGTTDVATWRRFAATQYSTYGNDAYKSTIWQGTVLNYAGTGYGPTLPTLGGGWYTFPGGWPTTWDDGTSPQLDALIGWPNSATSGQHFWKGQLWDAVVVQGLQVNSETTYTIDGHTFMAITHQSGAPPYGTLLVRVA